MDTWPIAVVVYDASCHRGAALVIERPRNARPRSLSFPETSQYARPLRSGGQVILAEQCASRPYSKLRICLVAGLAACGAFHSWRRSRAPLPRVLQRHSMVGLLSRAGRAFRIAVSVDSEDIGLRPSRPSARSLLPDCAARRPEHDHEADRDEPGQKREYHADRSVGLAVIDNRR